MSTRCHLPCTKLGKLEVFPEPVVWVEIVSSIQIHSWFLRSCRMNKKEKQIICLHRHISLVPRFSGFSLFPRKTRNLVCSLLGLVILGPARQPLPNHLDVKMKNPSLIQARKSAWWSWGEYLNEVSDVACKAHLASIICSWRNCKPQTGHENFEKSVVETSPSF